MSHVFINRIAMAVPPYDVHQKFVEYAPSMLSDEHGRKLFKRLAGSSGIEHRYSFLDPNTDNGQLDTSGFYLRDHFPDTQTRMQFYERHAFTLARNALDDLGCAELKGDITHLIVTSCTGFYAPGIDWQIIEHYELKPSIERTMIGFMGCYAAINGLKMARHIVRSEPKAKVIVLNLELCTLHLHEIDNLEQLLSFLIFADGCAATLVSSECSGIEIKSFHSSLLPESDSQITWRIGNSGFDMMLSGKVPRTIKCHLQSHLSAMLQGSDPQEIVHWAIHPGGSSILNAVQESMLLPEELLQPSRNVLKRYGNMSSATVMFVLKDMLEVNRMGQGCAMAFGPGISVESMLFALAGD